MSPDNIEPDGDVDLEQTVLDMKEFAKDSELNRTELGCLVLQIDREMRAHAKAASRDYLAPKPSDSETYRRLKKEGTQKQTEVARFLFENRLLAFKPYDHDSEWSSAHWRGFALFGALMRANLTLPPETLLSWILEIKEEDDILSDRHRIELKKIPKDEFGYYLQPASDRLYENLFGSRIKSYDWPFGPMIQQVERKARNSPLSEKALTQLRDILSWREFSARKESEKTKARIEALLAESEGSTASRERYSKLLGDKFSETLSAELDAQPEAEAAKWHQVFQFAFQAKASKPSGGFLTEAADLREQVGKEWFRNHVHGWFRHAISAKLARYQEYARIVPDDNFNDRYFSRYNVFLLKGLVWMCDSFQDDGTVNLVADLCEKSLKKIPGVGPASQALATACLWYLERAPGVQAAARLSRLGSVISQNSVKKKVRNIVAQKAERAGLTTIQLEERIVPEFGLERGVKTVQFDTYALRIRLEGPGDVSQTWLKADGTQQKTKPKAVTEKAALKIRLGKVREEIKALKKVLTAQRDRIEFLFAEDLEWPLADIERFYIEHGLVGTIAHGLIWDLSTDGTTVSAVHLEGEWQDVGGTLVKTGANTKARLWHPVEHLSEEVIAWQQRLGTLDIVQNIRQVYREVYHLTDVERKTDVYSNRMAAHMLKQHQMSALMASRGWQYQLIGCYDDDVDDYVANKVFVTSGLKAEFLIQSLWYSDEELWNDAGIYDYVGTDQIRFATPNGVPVKLETVPLRLFSETIRDADLFVAVASIGNDPTWYDLGPTPEAREYCREYSFGDLDGFARTRKAILLAALPRLKIKDVAYVDGRYLIVNGKLNTYKIHLGSSNILMEPDNRYLCIVPKAAAKASRVALPFEGDTRFSVILSKAIMLAADDRITDEEIVSQINPSE